MQNIIVLTTSYNRLQNSIDVIAKTINHQKAIQRKKRIPKRYQPKELFIAKPNNGILQKNFRKKYAELFLLYVNDVCQENEISLEIKKAKLQNILFQIEQEICLFINPNDIKTAYNQFVTQTGLTDHIPTTRLQTLLQQQNDQPIESQTTDPTKQKITNHSAPNPSNSISAASFTSSPLPMKRTDINEKPHPKKRKTLNRTTPNITPSKNHFLSKGPPPVTEIT